MVVSTHSPMGSSNYCKGSHFFGAVIREIQTKSRAFYSIEDYEALTPGTRFYRGLYTYSRPLNPPIFHRQFTTHMSPPMSRDFINIYCNISAAWTKTLAFHRIDNRRWIWNVFSTWDDRGEKDAFVPSPLLCFARVSEQERLSSDPGIGLRKG